MVKGYGHIIFNINNSIHIQQPIANSDFPIVKLFHGYSGYTVMLSLRYDQSFIFCCFSRKVFDESEVCDIQVSPLTAERIGNCKCDLKVIAVLTQSFADPHSRFVGKVFETLAHKVFIRHCGQSIDTGSHCAETDKQQELISCFRIMSAVEFDAYIKWRSDNQ